MAPSITTMAKTISPVDRPTIKTALGPYVEIIACTAAKVYGTLLRPDRWTLVASEGALALLKDRSLGGLFFRLVSLTDGRVIWEHEIYFDFEYRLDCEFFHSFESDKGIQIGFLFSSEKEAKEFANLVYQKSEILQLSTFSNVDGASRKGSIRSMDAVSSVKSMDTSSRHSSSNGGGARGFFSNLFKRNSKEKMNSPSTAATANSELTADDIGDPTDFQHLAHIGFNTATGSFDVQNIPGEWKAIFQKAGVTREQLENRETAGFIANFVKSNVERVNPSTVNQSTTTTLASRPSLPSRTKGPPPPPPAKSFKSPGSQTISAPNTANASTSPSLNRARPTLAPSLASTHRNNDRDDDEGTATTSTTGTNLPQIDADRAQLLASIRNVDQGKVLKPIQERSNSTGSLSSAPPSSDDQSDIMASMLAKALAVRNKKMAHHSSDEEQDNW